MNDYDILAERCSHNFSRYGTTFKTNNEVYFYDSGTGKVFACEELEFFILEALLKTSNMNSLKNDRYTMEEIAEGVHNIVQLIHDEHILSLPSRLSLYETPSSNHLQQVIFELTEGCNLRCEYCVYQENANNFRTFHQRHMTFDIAKKAIDHALINADKTLFVGFYGGEPLLNFPLMKQCISYIEEHKAEHEIYYSLTTNLTLVNKEIADFLASLKNITILCSMDGPEEIHDEYRMDSAKEGSFAKTIEGFKLLTDAFKSRSTEVLSVNTVICPPYDTDKLNKIKNFFNSTSIFPYKIKHRYSYVASGSLKNRKLDQIVNIHDFYQSDIAKTDPIKNWAMQELLSDHTTPYVRSIEFASIHKIHNRYLNDIPIDVMSRNGCCNPGKERLYVTVDGNYKICDKIGYSPSLGNVFNGLNRDVIHHEYFEQYDKGLDTCQDCWAVHICDICYAACYNQQGYQDHQKKEMCHAIKSSIKNNLVMYHQLLEEKPEEIDLITAEQH